MGLVPQDTIGFLIATARRRLELRVADMLLADDLTPQQFWILLLVLQGAELSSSDVAGRVSMDKATASRLIDRLVKRGWLVLRADPRDRRRSVIELTPEGRRHVERLELAAAQLDQEMVRGLDEPERARLSAALKRVIANLDGISPRALVKARRSAR